MPRCCEKSSCYQILKVVIEIPRCSLRPILFTLWADGNSSLAYSDFVNLITAYQRRQGAAKKVPVWDSYQIFKVAIAIPPAIFARLGRLKFPPWHRWFRESDNHISETAIRFSKWFLVFPASQAGYITAGAVRHAWRLARMSLLNYSIHRKHTCLLNVSTVPRLRHLPFSPPLSLLVSIASGFAHGWGDNLRPD